MSSDHVTGSANNLPANQFFISSAAIFIITLPFVFSQKNSSTTFSLISNKKVSCGSVGYVKVRLFAVPFTQFMILQYKLRRQYALIHRLDEAHKVLA